jgi:hypothetical protein
VQDLTRLHFAIERSVPLTKCIEESKQGIDVSLPKSSVDVWQGKEGAVLLF